MEKILKKYTTIPDHLYVKRGADNQLARIVEEMERPGYVLVARQMGKTNLLFYAKRSLENSNRLFAYVDLSNYFKEESDCYRNIIDNIVEPNELIFNPVIDKIFQTRNENLPPHREYTKSLRLLLSCFAGDLIIILDEIDALRSAPYSDHIFAQIRSNYFARTNFPEFERLSYILSGVIEPSELIKDKDKSPFNIGEKIYLDDFTYDEHCGFIEKSNLQVDSQVIDRIFKWTNGNPRLTFDISSEIENKVINGELIHPKTVDDLIEEKYLTTFDIAPIDHIRELVKNNKSVRQAVFDLQLGKAEISDEIKQKLYLYGIINYNYNHELKIKNEIIQKALNVDWIESVNKQSKDLLNYGLDKIDSKEYKEAIVILSEYLSTSKLSNDNKEICNYNIAYCHYILKDYDKAILKFSEAYSIEIYRRNSKSFLGMCFMGKGDYEKGVKILEQVISEKTPGFAYHNALLNLGTFYKDSNIGYAKELLNELISSFNDIIEADSVEHSQTLTLAYFYMAEIFIKENLFEDAYSAILNAKKYASTSEILEILYYEYYLGNQEDDSILEQISKIIIKNELRYDYVNNYPISYNEYHQLRYLNSLYSIDNKEAFNSLLEYSVQSLYSNSKSKYDLLFEIADITSNEEIKTSLYREIVDNIKNIEDESLQLKTYRNLSFLVKDYKKEFEKNFEGYIRLFQKLNYKVENDDISLFTNAIRHNSDSKNFDSALRFCHIIEQKMQDSGFDKFEKVIIYYWHSNLAFSMKNNSDAIDYADKTLEMIKTFDREQTSFLDEKGIKVISEQMNQIKISSQLRKPIIVDKKIGRNERIKVKYQNGLEKEGKYKVFEADILADRCIVVI